MNQRFSASKFYDKCTLLGEVESKPHVLMISSWYPTEHSSSGTFMEEFIMALQVSGVRVVNLLSEEVTSGNYLRAKLRGKRILNYRRHPAIKMLDNLCVHPLPLRLYGDSRKRRLEHIRRKAIQRVSKYIDAEGRPDFIFHHGVFDYTYITSALSAHFGIPYWFKEHSSYINVGFLPCTNDFEDVASLTAFVQGAQRRFAPSAHYAAHYQRVFGCGFEVLHNYLGSELFKVPAERPSRPPFKFVNVALMVPVKNQKLLIRSFAKAITESQLDASLTIAGDGELRKELLALVAQLSMQKHVHILRFQNRDQLRSLLDNSHAFVLSSDKETFGLVLIEAMARGLPVISSAIPGPMDLISQHTGLLFDPGDEGSLQDALVSIYQNYDQYDAHTISQTVLHNFGPEALRLRLFDKYE